MDNLQKKFKICGLENKDIKRIQANEEEKESIEINDDNFMEIVEKTLASIKNRYKIKNEIYKENSNINKQNKKIEKKRKIKYSRRFKILKHCLNELKNNNLSIDECMKKSPLQTRPYQLPQSLDFINAIKYDKFDKLEELLEFPELLYSFDYYRQTGFHWAVKLSKIKTLIMLLKCGNCINQTDINGFTPLALAAKYDNADICQILCDSGANPLIPNNDGLFPADLAMDIKLKSYLTVFSHNYSQKSNIKYL